MNASLDAGMEPFASRRDDPMRPQPVLNEEAFAALRLVGAAVKARSEQAAGASDEAEGRPSSLSPEAAARWSGETLGRALADPLVLSSLGKKGLTRDDVTEFARDKPRELVEVLRSVEIDLEIDVHKEPARRADVNSISAGPELEGSVVSPRATERVASEASATKATAEMPSKASREAPSFKPGDVPTDIARRYLTETSRWKDQQVFYEGHAAKDPVFHDRGNKLVSGLQSPAVIADMIAIAEHRGWKSIEVTGTEDFRREAWMKAREQGLEVRGYKPNERDLQELEKRREMAVDRRNDAIVPVKESGTPATKEAARDDRAPVTPGSAGAARETVTDAPTRSAVPGNVDERRSLSQAPASEQAVPQQHGRQLLSVSFAEREAAKAAGARWDKDAKSWYVDGASPAVARWVPDAQQQRAEAVIEGNRNAKAQMRTLEAVTAKVFSGDPDAARRVLTAGRNELASMIEQGKPIPWPELKSAELKAPEKASAVKSAAILPIRKERSGPEMGM